MSSLVGSNRIPRAPVAARLRWMSGALLAALLCGPTLASEPALGDSIAVTRVTGASPFPASCPMNSPFVDAEAEFSLAADPGHPSRVTTAWIQGSVDSVVSGYSLNGERSLQPVILPALQRCTGGRFDVSSDPWLSEGPDGVTYLATIPGS